MKRLYATTALLLILAGCSRPETSKPNDHPGVQTPLIEAAEPANTDLTKCTLCGGSCTPDTCPLASPASAISSTSACGELDCTSCLGDQLVPEVRYVGDTVVLNTPKGRAITGYPSCEIGAPETFTPPSSAERYSIGTTQYAVSSSTSEMWVTEKGNTYHLSWYDDSSKEYAFTYANIISGLQGSGIESGCPLSKGVVVE